MNVHVDVADRDVRQGPDNSVGKDQLDVAIERRTSPVSVFLHANVEGVAWLHCAGARQVVDTPEAFSGLAIVKLSNRNVGVVIDRQAYILRGRSGAQVKESTYRKREERGRANTTSGTRRHAIAFVVPRGDPRAREPALRGEEANGLVVPTGFALIAYKMPAACRGERLPVRRSPASALGRFPKN
jgi:hypothetical protein